MYSQGRALSAHFLCAWSGTACPLQSFVGQVRCAAVSIYLFRAGSSRNFAYSLDVTGRNIPPVAEDAAWIYQGTVDAEQLKAHPEAWRRLRADGFYLFHG
jgi:hypothetical protein